MATITPLTEKPLLAEETQIIIGVVNQNTIYLDDGRVGGKTAILRMTYDESYQLLLQLARTHGYELKRGF